MAERRFYGWTMLGSLWAVMFLNLGFPAYGPAVINAAMAETLGLHRETLGDMFSVYMIMSGLPGPAVAFAVNRIGVRRTLILGSLMILAGAVSMATIVTGGAGAMVAFGLLVGTGVATGAAIAAQTGLARWFVRRRSLALSVLYSAGAIGGFVAAPLLGRVISATHDWRSGWWVIAGLSALAAVVAAVFVRERPEDLGQMADGFGSHAARAGAALDERPPFVSRREWTLREALHHRTYWLILASLVGGSGGYTLFLAHGVVHLHDLGHPTSVGAWAVGIVTVSGLIGKAVLAALGDRIDPRVIWSVFMAVFAAGLLLVVDARPMWQVYLFAVCLGIGFGGGLVCLMSVLSNYYGTRIFASLSGLAIAVNTTLSAIAPKVAGRLYDQGYGYGTAFDFLAAWCFAGAIVLFLIRPPELRDAGS